METRFLHAAPGTVIAILVRHGSTQLNGAAKRVRGWQDDPLSPEGRIEAQLTGHKLRFYSPKSIHHSDFMRDGETAHAIGSILGLSPEAEYGLRTWDVGKFSGQREADANPALQELYRHPWEVPPGSGESFNTFSKRAMAAIDRLLHVAGASPAMRPVVIVTHGRPIALVHSYLEMLPPERGLMPKPGGIAELRTGADHSLGIAFKGETEPVV